MSRCYFCVQKFIGNETRVAVGDGKEVHAVAMEGEPRSCYENYRLYLRQIADAMTQDAKKRDSRPPP